MMLIMVTLWKNSSLPHLSPFILQGSLYSFLDGLLALPDFRAFA